MKNYKFFSIILFFASLIFTFSGCVTAPSREACPVKTEGRKVGEILTAAGIRKIVIDGGHGGTDPGAIGRTGLREKDVNLDLVKRLNKLLKSEGIEVVLTRSSDTFISLSRRVEITNNSRADLFVSIHSNANRAKGMNGFEIYYVSGSSPDSRRAFSAAKNIAQYLDAASAVNLTPNLKATLLDMVYTSNRADALELARTICRQIECDLQIKVLGIKSAGFYVLKGSHVPAILIEIGFLSNSNEEKMLKSGAYRQQIAQAIVMGIQNYAQNSILAQVKE